VTESWKRRTQLGQRSAISEVTEKTTERVDCRDQEKNATVRPAKREKIFIIKKQTLTKKTVPRINPSAERVLGGKVLSSTQKKDPDARPKNPEKNAAFPPEVYVLHPGRNLRMWNQGWAAAKKVRLLRMKAIGFR